MIEITKHLENLRIVILECPYDTWDDARVRELFHQIVSLKLAGYRARYEYGVLPVDTTDFVGSHILICRETESSLMPLNAYRSIDLARCHLHRIPFPALTLVQMARAREHEESVREILSRCEESGASLAYTSSWTMSPAARGESGLSEVLRELTAATYLFFHEERRIHEILVGGTPRFSTHKLFAEWGHLPLGTAAGGPPLPEIRVAHLLGEDVLMMHLKEFSERLREQAAPWRFMWKNRLVVGPKAEERKWRRIA